MRITNSLESVANVMDASMEVFEMLVMALLNLTPRRITLQVCKIIRLQVISRLIRLRVKVVCKRV